VQALLASAVRPSEERLVRFSALRALARREAPLYARDLGPATDDPWLKPVAFGVLGVGAADDSEAIEHLLKGLAAGSRSVREAAMAALLRRLGRVDGAAADELAERVREAALASPTLVTDAIERLRSADLATRLVLVQLLGLLRLPATIVPLVEAGRDEALGEVALASLEALGDAVEGELDARFATLDTESRRLACILLGRTHGSLGAARLAAALEDPEPAVRTAAATSLGSRGGAAALSPLVRRLEATAAEDAGEGEDEIAVLTSALVALAQPLGELHSEVADQAVAVLGARLEGATESVRLAIATVLGRIGRPQDVQLVTFLLKDESDRVRRAAVEALARIEPGEAPEPVRLALADESPLVRISAANALGASSSPRAREDLARLAEDRDPWVRAAALRALGAHAKRLGGVDEALLSLIERASADDGPVAMAAVEALRAIGGETSVRIARQLLSRREAELVQAAVGCVVQHGKAQDLEALLPFLSHDHWSVRTETIQGFAERGMVKAVPSILRRLETEQDDFVRDAILRALGRLEG
jgi:HEAT repeat protein